VRRETLLEIGAASSVGHVTRNTRRKKAPPGWKKVYGGREESELGGRLGGEVVDARAAWSIDVRKKTTAPE